MTSSPDTARSRIIHAAMDCIGETGWSGCTVDEICVRAGVDEAAFYGEFDGLLSVIAGAGRKLGAAMLEAAQEFEPDEAARDKLFALLMARFDAAKSWRPAIDRLARAAVRDPRLAAVGMNSLRTAGKRALDAAGIGAAGLFGPGRIAALATGVLLPVGRVWLKDDSEDLSKTMAALDRRLGRLERLASRLGPLAGARSRGRDRGASPAFKRPAPPPPAPPAKPAPSRKTGATGKDEGPTPPHSGGGKPAASKRTGQGRGKSSAKGGKKPSGGSGSKGGGSKPKGSAH